MAERMRKALPALPTDFEARFRFHGGLRLDTCRDISLDRPVRKAGIPAQLVLPLLQHIGEPADCLVSPGDRVYRGQVIAQPVGTVSAPVHASSSGTVIAVEPRPVPHPSGLPAPCIIIETDGEDSTGNIAQEPLDYTQADPVMLLEKIRAAGIVGLGGAGFPTRVKLARHESIELLLINGAECEPCISCDDSLMRERAGEVIEGVRILQHIVQPQACVIALEDNMPEAEQALRAALEAHDEHGITVTTVPAIYPTGGERQLIKVLTNREVPSQEERQE